MEDTKISPDCCGIYKITNKINGKCYIGQSVYIRHRWIEHKYKAFTLKDNNYFHNALRKYGWDNFNFEVIEQCEQNELSDKEIYWIKYYDSTNKEKGYNIKLGGNSGGSCYNYEEIYNLWKEGNRCKDIEKILNCNNQTVTKALRSFCVTKEMTNQSDKKIRPLVAIDIESNKPLKIFMGIRNINKFFNIPECSSSITSIIDKKRAYYGYYWERLNDNNKPKIELTDEEFLSYQRKPQKIYTDEEKIQMSLRQRKVERPSREELKNLIRTVSFCELGRRYGVSDNTIRKWCAFEKLPFKKSEIKSYSDEEWNLI